MQDKLKQTKSTFGFGTVEEIEYAGGWVDGICPGDTKDCPHLFICLCEEEKEFRRKKLTNLNRKEGNNGKT